MKKSRFITAVIATAALVTLLLALRGQLAAQQPYGQQYPPSYAQDFASINQKLNQIIANQGRMMSMLDRVWQDTRRRR